MAEDRSAPAGPRAALAGAKSAFAEELRDLHIEHGQPPTRTLSARAGGRFSHASAADWLAGKYFPNQDMTVLLVCAITGDKETGARAAAWRERWRAVKRLEADAVRAGRADRALAGERAGAALAAAGREAEQLLADATDRAGKILAEAREEEARIVSEAAAQADRVRARANAAAAIRAKELRARRRRIDFMQRQAEYDAAGIRGQAEYDAAGIRRQARADADDLVAQARLPAYPGAGGRPRRSLFGEGVQMSVSPAPLLMPPPGPADVPEEIDPRAAAEPAAGGTLVPDRLAEQTRVLAAALEGTARAETEDQPPVPTPTEVAFQRNLEYGREAEAALERRDPERAADLLDLMDPSWVASFLVNRDPGQAAAFLDRVDPDRVAVWLAALGSARASAIQGRMSARGGRRKNAPRKPLS